MADCSYSRCIQQRRNIRRELQRWTKNMVYIVGLERIAEELMGRRKWKLYQDSMQRNYLQPLNNNIKKSEKYPKDQPDAKGDEQHNNKHSNATIQDEESIVAANDVGHQHREILERLGGDTNGTTAIKEERVSPGPDEDEATRTTPKIEALDEEDDEKLKDWSPQSKCYFCVDGKLDEHNNHGGLSPRQTDSDSSDSRSDLEAPPTLTPAASLLNNLGNHRNMTALESVTSMAALAAVAALSGGNPQAAAAPHLPFYSPNLLQPNWFHLTNLARNFQAAERTEEKPVQQSGGGSGEQPLDLSSKGGGGGNANVIADGKMNANMRLPTLDSKHIFKAKPRMSAVAGRRTYTEDELQAALRDIQSGKLGTRRAAVIYGIPRSTLRNKIDEDEAMDDDKDLSGAEEEKEVEKALERPLLSMADILRFSNIKNADALQALLAKSKEGQEGGYGVDHSAIGGYIQNLLMGSMMKQEGADVNFPEMVKMMAEEQLLNEQMKTQNNGDSEKLLGPSPSNSVIMKSEKSKSESDMETEDSTSNVILKIPSFKPTSSKNGDTYRSPVDSNLVSPPITSESPPTLPGKGMMTLKDVKDVIAKTISQKFQQSPEPMRHPIMDQMDFKRSGFTPPLGISVIKQQPEITRSFQQQQQQQQKPQQQQQQNSSSGGGTTGGKGTRPKRGKYRNYDRDSLVEAVRAVQRGEMSVHRAGSYYGVPHSTLEYKVKERHLMRPRKRDPKPNPVDEKIASLKQNDIRNADKLKPQVIKPPQKFPPTSPNGIKLPIYDPNMAPMGYTQAPFPFWPHPSFHPIPLDYGRSSTSAGFPATADQFFASQMMQKLHEESSRVHPNAGAPLPKNARQMAESLLDGAGTNGFLDGIIRSSLESGVPGSDGKKEDKNVAPENMSNKALLDQLCRNSRLTPLTKHDDNSEDETKKSSPLNFASNNRERESENSMDHDGSTHEASDIQTIELSNDSNDSSKANAEEKEMVVVPPATGRIYLKQELTKPENLKPEMLVRYRSHDVERNGITEGSASESDAAQD